MKKFVMVAALAAGFAFAGSASALDNYPGYLLKKGVKGPNAHVMTLQNCLMGEGFANAGGADGYFGNLTAAQVTTYQIAEGLKVDGIVGPQTWADLDCQPNDSSEVEEEEKEENKFKSSNGEEADVTVEDIKKEDDLSNNEEEQHAFTFEVEADEDGGDAQVERVDLQFTISDAEGEDDLYDIIEKITIEVDGKEVASEASDDDDDWRGNDEDILRISGLDTIVKSDETVEFDVLLDIADLDEDDDLTGAAGITVELTSVEVRYTDEAGITDTVESDAGDAVDVEIEALDAIEFDIDESNDNPDQDETVSLDEDVDGVVAFVNDITVDEQDGTLEKVTVAFTTSTDLSAEDIDELVNEVTLEWDGDKIDADDINDLTATGFTAEFDMDDLDIEVDDEFEVTVTLDLEELEDGSNFIGESIEASEITFEGEDQDDDNFSVTEDVDNAVEISLSAGALKLEDSSVDGYNEVGSDDDAAKAKLTVEVKADGDEDMQVYAFEIDLDGEVVFFALEDQAFYSTAALALANAGGDVDTDNAYNGYTVTVKDGDNDDVTDVVEINDGSSEEFEITVFLDPSTAGEYELELEALEWEEDTNGDGDFNDSGADQIAGTLEVSLEADEIDLVA